MFLLLLLRRAGYFVFCSITNTRSLFSSPDGSKKAYVKLTADGDALDVAATKLSIA